jgi:hypothetical protein
LQPPQQTNLNLNANVEDTKRQNGAQPADNSSPNNNVMNSLVQFVNQFLNSDNRNRNDLNQNRNRNPQTGGNQTAPSGSPDRLKDPRIRKKK